MLEKLQEFNKEKGNDNDELVNIAARLNRMDATLQLEQDTRSLETAELGFQDAVDAKGYGGCQEGQARSEELYFISATVVCGQLQQSGAYPTNEVSMKFTWWPFRRGGPPEDAEQQK